MVSGQGRLWESPGAPGAGGEGVSVEVGCGAEEEAPYLVGVEGIPMYGWAGPRGALGSAHPVAGGACRRHTCIP